MSRKREKFFTGWQMKTIADKNIPYAGEAFSEFGDVVLKDGRDITAGDVRNADILLVRTVTHVGEELLRDSKVQYIGTATIGYDHIDTGYLRKRKIHFSSAAGCNANSVAEYIVSALYVLSGRYGLNLQNVTLGIIGAGNVGSKVIEKARALDIEVLINDPPKERATGQNIYQPLERVLKESDIISFHVPLTFDGQDATYRMGNHGLFSKMKEGAFVINTSRGPVIHTHALLSALYHGNVRSAVIDVWEGEPVIPMELLDCIDIGTPHIAGYSRDGKVNATKILYREACRLFNNEPRWQSRDLPPPEHPVITYTENGYDPGATIGAIIKKAYDIERDDRALRMMISVPKKERSRYFDRLRNEYPVRREFNSIKVETNRENDRVQSVLKALGFQLNKAHTSHESKELQ